MKPICYYLLLFSLLMGSCAPQQASLDSLKEWDLVWISDSTGIGVAELYARFIEQDRGVKVRVHDAAIEGLNAVRTVNALRGSDETHPVLLQLPSLIPQAEVIVIFINPTVNGKHSSLDCLNGTPLTKDCTEDCYTRYRTDLNTLFDEIFKLRAGASTVIRTYELWFRPAWWKKVDSITECTRCVGWFNAAISDVAARYHIPQAILTDIFNGPTHDEDPAEKGLIGSDNIHVSPAGRQAIAEALRALGYEPVKP